MFGLPTALGNRAGMDDETMRTRPVSKKRRMRSQWLGLVPALGLLLWALIRSI